MKFKVLFAFFPYGNRENPSLRKWFTRTIMACKAHPNIGEILDKDFDDTPITMSRNAAEKLAREQQCDLLCMVDSDMKPDLYLNTPGSGAKPFWDSSLEFVLNHQGPCVVAAPYCGKPPHENTMVCTWRKAQSEHPNVDMRLALYEREEAAVRAGFEEVGALPTGLILIDMRVFKYIEPPYFEYEYADPPYNTQKATTEDIYFTRNLSLAGVPQYVNWDAWAGHFKEKCVGKPTILTKDLVAEGFREAIKRDWHSKERLIDLRNGVPINGQCVSQAPFPGILAQAQIAPGILLQAHT